MSRELYLIDGYSVIYRGYFAFLNRPLLNPLGQNSSAVFVFFRTLFQVMRGRAPESIAVAMDSRVPTFRHLQYEAYKATRDKAPEDLHAQVPVIEEILESLGVPCLSVNGFEADDVIATLAESCRVSGVPCWIMSGDKDILQLIGGNIRLLAQEKSDLVEYSREKVFESKGVYPEQIVDFLAMTGDSSDNVPGVPGIGEKTAQKLLAQFGSLDAIYARLSEVAPPAVRAKLEAGKESAMLSRRLVTLKRDVPGIPSVESLAPTDMQGGNAAALFEREGMKTLAAELKALRKGSAAARPSTLRPEPESPPGTAPETAPAAPAAALKTTAPGTYTTVTALSELDLWIQRARRAGLYSFEVETDRSDEMRAQPLGFSLSIEEGKACYVPIRAAGVACIPEAAVKQRIAGLLEDPAVRLVARNAKYDYKVMRRWGVRPANVHCDTTVAAWILESDEGSYDLDRLAEKYLSFRTRPYADLVGKDQTLEQVPIQQVTDYSGEEADLTLRLYGRLSPDLAADGLDGILNDIEMPLLTVLAEMELTGIRILSPELAAYSREMETSLAVLEAGDLRAVRAELQHQLDETAPGDPLHLAQAHTRARRRRRDSPRTWTCWRSSPNRTRFPRRSLRTASFPS